jgi:prolyl-tRNA editing enzyme YbaK/EbsC (Cys-tRNA(Pro) deacylase)
MDVTEIRSLLATHNLVLGPRREDHAPTPAARLGIEWGTASLAAVRLRRKAYESVRADLDEACPVQAATCGEGSWLFDAIGARANVRSVQEPTGSEFRRIALHTPDVGTFTDLRQLAVLEDPAAWHDLLTIVPAGGGRFDGCPWFAPAPHATPSEHDEPKVEQVATPGIRTVEQLEASFAVPPEDMIKTLVVVCTRDGWDRPVLCALRGDDELDLGKVRSLTGSEATRLASASEVEALTGSPVGFAGPSASRGIADVVFDVGCPFDRPVICGRHVAEHHLFGARIGRDIPAPAFVFDIRKGPCRDAAGFRVVWLRSRYEALVRALLEDRLAPDLRPFDVVVLPARPADLEHAVEVAGLHSDHHVDLDDRPASFGRRMTDWELLVPRRTVVVGRGFTDGVVDVAIGSGGLQERRIDDLADEGRAGRSEES